MTEHLLDEVKFHRLVKRAVVISYSGTQGRCVVRGARG